MEQKNEILELSFDFALAIIEFSEVLENKKKYVISRQLLKSGTSIGANIREAQNAHSRNDFISKCVIAMKEADETEYWLLLCEKSPNYPNPEELLLKILSIKKLLSKIISSSIKNRKNEK
ncbi:MAG: four helix bundle protein [Flavobacteriales bacterium CG03_land_8_20_14_0_80_35_15]|nr:MAG: four helix bundle protein [Flavobacteriales bacterium CG03_land_8_20_14_0_80_35_15]PJA07042.1 MAG: four helix bundle protein [Flavobacteriales bacterium CG_4_10_14_0_2_um_filter_35_18]